MFRNSDAQIKWAGTGKCLDLTDGKPVIGNPVGLFFRLFFAQLKVLIQIQLWDCAVPSDNLNQFWDIFPSDLIP
jgi:hypothetical protein